MTPTQRRNNRADDLQSIGAHPFEVWLARTFDRTPNTYYNPATHTITANWTRCEPAFTLEGWEEFTRIIPPGLFETTPTLNYLTP